MPVVTMASTKRIQLNTTFKRLLSELVLGTMIAGAITSIALVWLVTAVRSFAEFFGINKPYVRVWHLSIVAAFAIPLLTVTGLLSHSPIMSTIQSSASVLAIVGITLWYMTRDNSRPVSDELYDTYDEMWHPENFNRDAVLEWLRARFEMLMAIAFIIYYLLWRLIGEPIWRRLGSR